MYYAHVRVGNFVDYWTAMYLNMDTERTQRGTGRFVLLFSSEFITTCSDRLLKKVQWNQKQKD